MLEFSKNEFYFNKYKKSKKIERENGNQHASWRNRYSFFGIILDIK